MLLEAFGAALAGTACVMQTQGVMRLGLTGGIGSGKSTAAKALERAGAVIVDADQVSRQLTAPGGGAIPAIQQCFGPGFVQPDGAMNRAAMRDLVFQDVTAKIRLENILHPLIYTETELRGLQAARGGARCIVFDLPLLAESGHWRQRLDHVLVIDCDPSVQVRRVVQRSQLQAEQVQAIMAQQATRIARLRVADTVINNTLISIVDLHLLVETFLNRLLSTKLDQWVSHEGAVGDMITLKEN